MTSIDARNTNSLWCSVLVETLVRCGLRTAVVSPGSRCTPLTMALAAHAQVDAVPVLDERSAAFFALGVARRTGTPVVLVCTSGSAAAHYLPALIEAHEARVPLIAITADRPPEMRDCASGQTIDQHKIFGDFVTWYHEFAVPEPRLEMLAYLRQTVRQGWRRAVTAQRPIHFNAPFRDPLPPVADDGTAARTATAIGEEFFAFSEAAPVAVTGLRLHQRITTTRGLIVAGAARSGDVAAYARHVCDIARATGWPVLADVLSPVRQHAPDDVVVVTAYDAILRNETRARDLTPRFVIGLEGWPTSKVLRQWLERSQAEMLLVSEHVGARDALHGRTREVTAPASALRIEGCPAPDRDYVTAWAKAERTARGELDKWFSENRDSSFEGQAAWLLQRHLPKDATLVVANSMPVRDIEYFWGASNRNLDVSFSRGANGIDGTLSTALGTAHRSERPTYLLTGDLAFMHDANGFLLARELVGSLTVVVINNDGGGIFGHLPVAQFEPPFERYFATPQTVDLGKLCEAHGVAWEIANDAAALEQELKRPPAPGVRVIEFRTDRKADAATRKRLFRDVAAGL